MPFFYFFFFNDTATTEIYTLSLHDALPICGALEHVALVLQQLAGALQRRCHDRAHLGVDRVAGGLRSEEHTSELQSQSNLVCRLLLEKKKNKNIKRWKKDKTRSHTLIYRHD